MNPIERLRLKTNPKPGKPPAGHVDFIYSETMGGMAVRDSDGNDTLVAGGNTSTSATGRQVVALSTVAVNDTDLSRDGTTVGVNQTTLIQAVLDMALTAPLTVIWDVAVTAADLLVYPNTRIECAPGCGAKMPDDANKPILSNANYAAGADQASWTTNPNYSLITRDANIEIIGGIWHGNGSNQDHDTPEDGWIVALRFFNIESFLFDNITIYNPKTFSIHFCNAQNGTVRNSTIDCGVTLIANRDGIHIDGNSDNLKLLNNTIRSWDDAISLTADDLETQSSPAAPSPFGPYANFGSITNILVDGLHFYNGRFGIRILSGLSRVDGITIRNVTGALAGHLLLIDNYTEDPSLVRNTGPGNVGRIVIDGVNVSATDISTYKNALMFISLTVESLTLRNVEIAYDETGVDLPVIQIGTNAATGIVCALTDFTTENFKLLGPTGTESTPLTAPFLVTGNATVSKLTMTNTVIRRRSTKVQPVGSLVTVNGSSTATVTNLTIDGLVADHLASEIATASTGVITNRAIRNSNVFAILRGGALTNMVTRDALDPTQYYITGAANEGGVHAMFGGGAPTQTDTVFSLIVKLPASFAGSSNVAVGSRTSTWNLAGNNEDGYIIAVTGSNILFGKSNTSFTFTTITTHNTALTVSEEYYIELRCIGTAITGYIQRLSDNKWLTTVDATWQTDRVACFSTTDATYTGKWSHVSLYPGTSGGSKTARYRDIKHRSA